MTYNVSFKADIVESKIREGKGSNVSGGGIEYTHVDTGAYKIGVRGLFSGEIIAEWSVCLPLCRMSAHERVYSSISSSSSRHMLTSGAQRSSGGTMLCKSGNSCIKFAKSPACSHENSLRSTIEKALSE